MRTARMQHGEWCAMSNRSWILLSAAVQMNYQVVSRQLVEVFDWCVSEACISAVSGDLTVKYSSALHVAIRGLLCLVFYAVIQAWHEHRCRRPAALRFSGHEMHACKLCVSAGQLTHHHMLPAAASTPA